MRRELVSAQPDDPATVSHLSFTAHTGSHIDAPVHFLVGGAGVESFVIASFVGPCFVADFRDVDGLITGDHLEDAGVPDDVPRVISLSQNSGWSQDTEFRSDYVAYALSAAEWCVSRGIVLLGNDYLSVEAFDSEDFGVHKKLLGAGVAILEGVDLAGVSPGVYELVALPVLIPGSDGAPVRAVLIDDRD